MDADASAIPLSHLPGFRIADGALDVRGWDVCSAEGRRIGVVDEVLVDTGAMQVRYLDVEVENMIVTGRERHVLIPVDGARRTPAPRRAIIVPGLAARAVPGLPSYTRGAAVREGYPVIAPPMSAVAPHAAHEPIGLPIGVKPSVIVRPFRLPPRESRAEAAAAPAGEPARRAGRTRAAEAAVAASAGPRAA